jgi:hypothetical protein
MEERRVAQGRGAWYHGGWAAAPLPSQGTRDASQASRLRQDRSMSLPVNRTLNGAYSVGGSQVLWEDGERVFRRGWRLDDAGKRRAVLIVLPAAEHPSRSSLDRLTHEYELKGRGAYGRNSRR